LIQKRKKGYLILKAINCSIGVKGCLRLYLTSIQSDPLVPFRPDHFLCEFLYSSIQKRKGKKEIIMGEVVQKALQRMMSCVLDLKTFCQ
jgi:hypothetical protein